MKTKLELIKNYPIDALKNWGDYFGYPEVICKEMTDMVDCDWQNSKIAVLDDFSFQMINFLIKVKNVPLQNIFFLVSETDETKVDLMKKWYSNFVENEISPIYIINSMSFDLIIANPPYGDKSFLCKRISNIIHSCAETCIVLEPFGGIEKCYPYCEDFKKIEEPWKFFPDVGISNLNIFKMKSRVVNDSKTLEDFVNKDNWFGEYLKLNRSRKAVYDRRTANVKCKEQNLDEKRIFYLPNWLVQHIAAHGPLFDKTLDNLHNIYGAKIDWNTPSVRTAGDRFIYFKTRTEFRNFRRWVYKEKKLFTKICERMWFVGNKAEFEKFLPRVDWTHPHDDISILKELGLSEDFLEKD